MDTDTELKALRYLLNNLILYVYDLRVKLEEIAPSKKQYNMGEPNANGDTIAFDLFSISKDKYKLLVDKYGVDVITEACVRLDEFIKMNEYIPYKTGYNAINRRFIKEVLFDREQKRKAMKPIVKEGSISEKSRDEDM